MAYIEFDRVVKEYPSGRTTIAHWTRPVSPPTEAN